MGRSKLIGWLAAGALVASACVLGVWAGALPALAKHPPASVRRDVALADGWKFIRQDVPGAQDPAYDDSAWSDVSLPHTWNAEDGQQHTTYYRGPGWYRLHYLVPKELKEDRLYLQFDGANLVTGVYANGTLLGEHRGGYAGFRFDATGQLQPGARGVIAVKVDNARNNDVAPLTADFRLFGGLYRMVHLVATDQLHLSLTDFDSSGVYLKTTNVSAKSADLEVTAKVVNDSSKARKVTLESEILDAKGKQVADLTAQQKIEAGAEFDFVQATTIAGPHLWNGRSDPYLYTADVSVIDGDRSVDEVTQPLGFRSFSVDADNGFFLNGEHLALHGVNKHQDRLDKGWAVSPEDQDQDFQLMEEMGVNAVRLAHYQHAQHEYDLADHDGMVVWAELPLVNSITNSQGFTDNAVQQLTELIRQNFNHPSIFFWSISNEVGGSPDPRPLQRLLNDVVHQEDPTRLSTHASAGTDPNISTDIYGSNRYYGWYYGVFGDFGPWADSAHAAHDTCPVDDCWNIGISEYGAGSSVLFHSDTPVRQDHTEEWQNLFHESHWQQIETRQYLWGTFVWNMFDFASAGRNEGDTPGRNDKGLVTFDRQTRKDAFYWYKANWAADPFVYITSRRFNPRTQPGITVKVYGNADSVALRVNGVDLGVQTSDNHIYQWNVTLAPGDNRVVAIGSKGGRTFADSVVWTYQQPDTTVVRVDSGSATAYTDSHGDVWDADHAYSGGTPGSKDHAVGGTDDPALYLTYRYGTFSYSFPVANGTYDLCLKFIEPYWTGPGQRVFSVSAQGQALLSDFDIFAQVGQFYALDQCFQVEVDANTLNVQFTSQVDMAVVSALSAVRQE